MLPGVVEGVKACNGIGVAIPKLDHYRFVLSPLAAVPQAPSKPLVTRCDTNSARHLSLFAWVGGW